MLVMLNFLAYQLGWFAVIGGAARGLPWLGTLVAVGIVGWHLSRARDARPEAALILAAAAIGVVFDSILPLLGWVTFPNGMLVEGTAPHWMVALWMMFATTLNVSLAWMKRSLVLAAALGATGGPLAYWAGAALGGLAFAPGYDAPALWFLAIGWGVLTPALVLLARRWNGFDESRPLAGARARSGRRD